jgi:hypothetical protein
MVGRARDIILGNTLSFQGGTEEYHRKSRVSMASLRVHISARDFLAFTEAFATFSVTACNKPSLFCATLFKYICFWGRRGTRIDYWRESQRERDQMEDQDVGGWIILGLILERWDGVM